MTTNPARPTPSRPTNSIAPAATALAVLASAGSAAAQVITPFFPSGATITPGQTLYIDIDGSNELSNPSRISTSDSTGADFAFTFLYNSGVAPAIQGFGTKPALSSTYPAGGYVARLSYNALINGSDFAPIPPPGKPMAYYGNGPWATATSASGYVGFGFIPPAGTRYGWMDVTYDTSGGGSLTVNEWAYDPNGNFVRAGSLVPVAVPEPATTSALIGAAVLAGSAVMMRRRREKLAAAAA